MSRTGTPVISPHTKQPNPKFTERSTLHSTHFCGALSRSVRRFCRTEQRDMPYRCLQSTSRRSANFGLKDKRPREDISPACPHPDAFSPNSRTSICPKGPCMRPVRERGADYRRSFTMPPRVVHTMDNNVRLFGEKKKCPHPSVLGGISGVRGLVHPRTPDILPLFTNRYSTNRYSRG